MKINSRNADAYRRHIELLCYLAGDVDYFEGMKIYKKLRYYDNKYCRFNEDECNIPDISKALIERREKRLYKVISELLPNLKTFFLNGDPRGHALKYKDEEVHELRTHDFNPYQDWGGYGLLAPEF